MSRQSALFWSWLNVLNRERYEALLEVYGSFGDATKHLGEELLRGLGCRQDAVERTLGRMDEWNPGAYEAEMERLNVRFLQWGEEEYPKLLAQVPDAPPFLYARGDLSLLGRPCVALVGTRDSTQYGESVASMFAAACARAGVVTVSGLAEGIDAVIAEEALRENGKTVAVLGHGLSMTYPAKHRKLAERIAESGLLLSEFPMNQEPEQWTFPSRNRIIAGLSLATVVLEAPVGSGALITADLALDYNRDVFAVPGRITDPTFEGSHRLLATSRAKAAVSPADMLAEIGVILPEATEEIPPDDPDERRVWDVLTSMPMPVDTVAEATGMSVAQVQAVLTILELQNRARRVGGDAWVRH